MYLFGGGMTWQISQLHDQLLLVPPQLIIDSLKLCVSDFWLISNHWRRSFGRRGRFAFFDIMTFWGIWSHAWLLGMFLFLFFFKLQNLKTKNKQSSISTQSVTFSSLLALSAIIFWNSPVKVSADSCSFFFSFKFFLCFAKAFSSSDLVFKTLIPLQAKH